MRVHRSRFTNLAAFVPAHFTLPENPIVGMAGVYSDYPTTYKPSHPAVGIGAFVDAHFTLPQNPVGGAGFAGLPYTSRHEDWISRSEGVGGGIGQFVDARFTLPQNPFLITGRDLATQGALAGMGDCGCGGSCGGCGGHGMGDLNSIGDTISGMWTSLNSTSIGGVPMGYVVVGGVALLIFMTGRGKEYRSAKRDLKKKYSTRGRRVAAAVA